MKLLICLFFLHKIYRQTLKKIAYQRYMAEQGLGLER